ncbi:tRNA epoxyqueuosine(34) reductase QueG [Natronincola peptidivorans]|nr:tRNA epoxyqueuosine(34) reductase QueG [Natronincola peptidivorans]
MMLKNKVIDYGRSIGIDMMGFTSAEAFEDLRDIINMRKKAGYLSGFAENDIELRVNPKKTMSEAKSILVIGVPYYVKDEMQHQEKLPEFYGELARTAWGKDYHQVLKEKMENIASFIKKEEKDFQYKIFVDTGPLVDRHVAYRAGLGWYGYNSLLMNKKYGSWFFIGYMLNNIAFEADKESICTTCYQCNLCIKHCPKGAIEAPYKFNAQKCLSNILQQKGDIGEEDRSILGQRLYGCDICQSVCPHNKEIEGISENYFYPKDVSCKPDLIELLNISNKEFKETYGKTSAGWRGKTVLQRNAIIAIVNQQKSTALPHLLPLLQDIRPEIRKYAVWAISVLAPQEACKILMKTKAKEKNQEVLKIIEYYLDKLTDEEQ